MTGGEESAQIKAANKIGSRDLILATEDTSLTMVANAKTDALSKGDLHLAWKNLKEGGILSQEKTRLILS